MSRDRTFRSVSSFFLFLFAVLDHCLSAGGSGARGDLSDADAGSDDEFGIILD